MGAILLIFIAIILLSYLWLKKHFNYWNERGFPQINGTFPFGSLVGAGTEMCFILKYDSFYKEYKGKSPVVGFYNFLSPAVLVISPEVIKTVLVREFSSFHNRGFYYNKRDDPISISILTLEGQEWKDRRSKFTPMFSSGKIKMMFEIVNLIGDQLVEAVGISITESENQEMRIWAQRYTSDTIGNVAFGLETGCLQSKNSDFLKNGKRFFELKPHEILKFIFTSELPELARKLRLRFTPKDAGDFFLQTFLETFQYRENNNINRNDFVQLLLGLKDFYTATELAAEAFLMYNAGFETSSTLINYILYELALNPDIQDRLREEIMVGIEENDGKLTYDLLFEFKYLGMVISEGLRKYPPLPNIFRKCSKDFKFPDTEFLITKGRTVIINTYSLHHDAEYFPNPSKFDPERFNDENIKNIKPFTYLPFSEGPRNCIGMKFGQMQSRIAITKLIKNFKFSPCEKTSIPIKFKPSSPLIEPLNGMWLKVEKILDN